MPSGPALHALPVHKAKPLCFHAARLASANRQTLERLARGRILHRHASWKNRSAEGRVPSGPALHALPVHKAKPPCFQAGRLGPASRQALERLMLKFLQILLHAEPPALLFYRGKRCWASSSEKRSKAEPRASLAKRLRKRLQALKACHLLQMLCALLQQYRLVSATL